MAKYFKAYTLSAEPSNDIDIFSTKNVELEELMSRFDPMGDDADAVILYLLTGDDPKEIMKDWYQQGNDDDPGDDIPVCESPGATQANDIANDFTI